MQIDMTRIDQIIQEITGAEKIAHAESDDLDSLIIELEKVAEAIDSGKEYEALIQGDGITLESETEAKQRLKETILEGVKSNDPSPICQELKRALVEGDVEQAEEILEKVAAKFNQRVRTLKKR